MELDSSPEEIDELQRQVDRLKMEKSYLLGNPKDDAAAQKAENELDESAKERLDDLNKEIADKSEKLNGLKARWDAEKNGPQPHRRPAQEARRTTHPSRTV